MAKPKQTRRAKNKIGGATPGTPIKADSFAEAATPVHRAYAVSVPRSTLFTAELEEIIDIIARDRVYRELRARLERRLLNRPTSNGDPFNP